MKKLLRWLLSFCVLGFVLFSWLMNTASSGGQPNAEAANALPEKPPVVVTETPYITPEPTPEITPEPTVPAAVPQNCDYGGEWQVDIEQSDYASMLLCFGTAFRDYGSLMQIQPMLGTMSIYAGLYGFEGVFQMQDKNVIIFSGNNLNDDAIETILLTAEGDYLVQQVGEYTVYWCRK